MNMIDRAWFEIKHMTDDTILAIALVSTWIFCIMIAIVAQ